MVYRHAGCLALLATLSLLPLAARAETIVLSANDGIEQFGDGAYKPRPNAGTGSLTALSLSGAPRILWHIPVDQTAVGPPTALALTPDHALALLSNPATLDAATGKIAFGQDLQIVDLTAKPPRISRLALGHRPWGLSIDPTGHHGLVANGDGTVTLLKIEGHEVSIAAVITLGTAASKTMGTAFTRDGQWALVTRRGDGIVTVLHMTGDTAEPVRDITVGSNPYAVVVSPDGKRAAVSNIGRNSGDRDSVSLIELETEPFRAVDIFSVAPTPEGIAFSPDSRRLAVNSINGSNLKHDHPLHGDHSLVQLFDVSAGPHLLGTAEVGANAQGVAFTPDGASLLVQDYATDNLLVFEAAPSGLGAVKARIAIGAGPAAVALWDVPTMSGPGNSAP